MSKRFKGFGSRTRRRRQLPTRFPDNGKYFPGGGMQEMMDEACSRLDEATEQVEKMKKGLCKSEQEEDEVIQEYLDSLTGALTKELLDECRDLDDPRKFNIPRLMQVLARVLEPVI